MIVVPSLLVLMAFTVVLIPVALLGTVLLGVGSSTDGSLSAPRLAGGWPVGSSGTYGLLRRLSSARWFSFSW